MRKIIRVIVCCALAWGLLVLLGLPPHAIADSSSDVAPKRFTDIQMEWGGYARAIGTLTTVADDSLYDQVDEGPYIDGQAEWRQKNRLSIGSHWTVETHYELVAAGGDTRQTDQRLLDQFPGSSSTIFINQPMDDDRRLLDLTHVLTETNDTLVYHRLDRLNLTWSPDWGTVRLGRQALTWGDGLVFNPMDLVSPFAPTTVQRDYKTGDDMALVQLPVGKSDAQLLYLPRRDPQTGDVKTDASSVALQYHAFAGSIEASAMAARHFDDTIGGLGASGYLGESAWRINTVYTHLSSACREDDFFQVVANLDYAWMWGTKNVYGLLEFYYNGLGRRDDYQQALDNEALMRRLLRGEMFTMGRFYLAGQIQVELHPLVQWHTTAIFNLADPSGLLHPQVLWDMATDLQLILGVQWHWGADGTEFGGFNVNTEGAVFNAAPSDQVYLWLTYYF